MLKELQVNLRGVSESYTSRMALLNYFLGSAIFFSSCVSLWDCFMAKVTLGVRLKATYHFEAYCCPLKCVVFSVVFPQTYDEVGIADDLFGLINPCLYHRW